VQGSSHFSTCYGAFHDEHLVAIMGFGHPTRQSIYECELKRFCSNGKIYPGIASKLFQTFIREQNPQSIISFCDKRYFVGKSYDILGFRNDGEIPPDYSYTNDYRTRHHKSKFKLKRLQKIAGFPIEGKTEWQIMQEMGYDRIWDCGKIRYVWEKDLIVDK
jgi:hypothetical protein